MVFVIHHSQNKDSLAIPLKVNESIAAEDRIGYRLVDVANLIQAEPETLKRFYITLSDLAGKENDLFSSRTVDEADEAHRKKVSTTRKCREAHSKK